MHLAAVEERQAVEGAAAVVVEEAEDGEGDELLINLNMADREINKNSIFITVRNVEDLNGNRTVSPTMWQVFVNKNTLLWDEEGVYEVFNYAYDEGVHSIPVRIRNTSGRRHQFSIEGLPDWLTVDRPYGSIDPQESLTLDFSIDSRTLAVGTYSEIIYLTDEEGLSEPLKVRIDIKSLCPWYGVEVSEFDRQMTLCGQVKIDGLYMTNPEDVVVAMAGDSVVGYAHVSPELSGGGSYVFMTVYGTESTEGRQLRFRAWQATTGLVYNLSTDEAVFFHSDAIVGLPPEEPVLLGTQTSSSATVTVYQTVFTDKVTFYVGENQYENKEISVTVCDALGRQLLHEVRPIVNSQFSTLNLKEFSSGVYFATVTYGNSATTVKLIKK